MGATTYAGRCERDGVTVTVTVEVSEQASYADQDELAEVVGPAAVQTHKRIAGWRDRATAAPTAVHPPDLKCTCGHHRSTHIYDEGACRPGVACPCESFTEQAPF